MAKQLSFNVAVCEKYISKTNGTIHYLGSPEYEEQAERKIKHLLKSDCIKDNLTP